MKSEHGILILCGINCLVFLALSMMRAIEIINPFQPRGETILYEVAFLLLCAFLPIVLVIIFSQQKR